MDRDGDLFAPLLNFLRSGVLHIPPTASVEAIYAEADFYAINLPPPSLEHERWLTVRVDKSTAANFAGGFVSAEEPVDARGLHLVTTAKAAGKRAYELWARQPRNTTNGFSMAVSNAILAELCRLGCTVRKIWTTDSMGAPQIYAFLSYTTPATAQVAVP